MTASPDLGGWLRQQREHRSWTRTEMARRLIRVAQVSGDTAMPAAEDVAAGIPAAAGSGRRPWSCGRDIRRHQAPDYG